MKYLVWFIPLLVFAVFLVGCASSSQFKDGYDDLVALDAKYDVNFHKEKLNGTMMRLELMNDYLADLAVLRADASDDMGNETQDVLNLLDARALMIESERYWLLAKRVGPAGVVTDGFSCDDISQIREASLSFLKSWDAGVKSLRLFDEVLARNVESRSLLGTNRDKLEFYRSPLDDVADDVSFNINEVFVVCKVQI
ncbi:MAG TPA: hypothetical protein VJB87_03050 [Candidatus Nanoarchaeia archaeon]|nr:hypothetical protein [Candidatus Nanoarchaeia archaeon]